MSSLISKCIVCTGSVVLVVGLVHVYPGNRIISLVRKRTLEQSKKRCVDSKGADLLHKPFVFNDFAGAIPVSYTHLTLPTIYSV